MSEETVSDTAPCGCPWNNGYKREPLAPHQHRVDCPEFADHDDLPPFDD